GNAAIFYHRAIEMVLQSRANEAYGRKTAHEGENKSTDQTISDWVNAPPDKFPRDEVRKRLDAYKNTLNEIELGASRQTCDWELYNRSEGYSLLLGEIQEMRSLARLVAVKARLELLDGKLDEAIRWYRIGQTMGRHAAEGPTLIQGLVGISISFTMNQGIEAFIQRPGAPNLYWAMATRPRPFVDLGRAIEAEQHIIERELPELNELEGSPWSVEKARLFGDKMLAKLIDYTGQMRMITPARITSGSNAPRLEELSSRLGVAAMVARVYPQAKRALIAEGLSAADVEAMPTLQAVLLHTLRVYNRFRDDNNKWTAFPYWQMKGHEKPIWKPGATAEEKFANPFLTTLLMLVPATESALLAQARLDRQFDALQCVEAIRMYAADHGGTLPASLDAMTDTPLPIDPVTGKAFGYTKVDDTTATLTTDYPVGGPKISQYRINYELKLAK
ncbi:MAG: hypothetical protein ABS79_07445, partial [Planctomycetes bacterium SCN 63-9]